MHAERRTPPPPPTPPEEVVLTLSLAEAKRLRALSFYNVTIPDAVAKPRFHIPNATGRRDRTSRLLNELGRALKDAGVEAVQADL